MPRSAEGPAIGRPSRVITPSVASARPAIRRSRVDLPQPEGPTITDSSRSGIASEMSSSAVTVGPGGP